MSKIFEQKTNLSFQKLLRLSKVNTTPDFPLRASTLYKWRHINKYPELFVKLGSAVFVDLQVLERILERSRNGEAA